MKDYFKKSGIIRLWGLEISKMFISLSKYKMDLKTFAHSPRFGKKLFLCEQLS